jgi:hypothetical protein
MLLAPLPGNEPGAFFTDISRFAPLKVDWTV